MEVFNQRLQRPLATPTISGLVAVVVVIAVLSIAIAVTIQSGATPRMVRATGALGVLAHATELTCGFTSLLLNAAMFTLVFCTHYKRFREYAASLQANWRKSDSHTMHGMLHDIVVQKHGMGDSIEKLQPFFSTITLLGAISLGALFEVMLVDKVQVALCPFSYVLLGAYAIVQAVVRGLFCHQLTLHLYCESRRLRHHQQQGCSWTTGSVDCWRSA